LQKKFEDTHEINTGERAVGSENYAIIAENIWKTFKIPVERRYKLHQIVSSFILRKNRGYHYLKVLEGISFKIRKGEVFGIIGENGCGKSTLLKILARIIYPDDGVLKIGGKVASFIELGVGFDFEFTAEENIYLYGAILGLPKKTIRQKMAEIYEFAELEKFRYMKLRNFSSGMILRLAFATAIQMDPDILLIDEVLAVGDKDFQEKCLDKINEYVQNKKTIVFVSHDLGMVKKVANNVMWVNKGKIASFGRSDKVIRAYADYMAKKTQKRLEEKDD